MNNAVTIKIINTRERGNMFTISDIVKLTEFDCYCCLPVLKCNDIGSMECRAVFFANMACIMILNNEYM